MSGSNAAATAPARVGGCAAPVGGVPVPADGDGTRRTVIEGAVRRDASPVAGAYVRLLDGAGEFAAEVVTDEAGRFRFYAAPGSWTVRVLAPRSPSAEVIAVVRSGSVAEVAVELAS
ncbi:MAG: DUF1416 domain-containing protein [Actinomycetes bacterium]